MEKDYVKISLKGVVKMIDEEYEIKKHELKEKLIGWGIHEEYLDEVLDNNIRKSMDLLTNPSEARDRGLKKTISEFRRIASELKLTKVNKKGFRPCSIHDLLKMSIKDKRPIVEGFIKENDIVILAGPSRSKKTFWVLTLGLFICIGEQNFMDLKINQSNVLFIDLENRLHRIKSRIEKIAKGHNLDLSKVIGLHVDTEFNLKLDSILNSSYLSENSELNNLINYIRANDIKLLVLDSLVRFMCGSENDVENVRRVFDVLKKISEECGCGIIVIHHTRKPNGRKMGASDLRGSSDILAMSDLTFVMNINDDKTSTLTCEKDRDGNGILPITFKISDTNNGIKLEKIHENNMEDSILTNTKKTIGQWLSSSNISEFRTKEAHNIIGKNVSRSYKDQALKQLSYEGVIKKKGRGRWQNLTMRIDLKSFESKKQEVEA
jgi:archaellum biogenesis ATPase FlaH